MTVAGQAEAALLEVRGLRTVFPTDAGEFAAVDGVDFDIRAGRTLAIVGESGCGKSVTSLSIMGLLPVPERTGGGSIRSFLGLGQQPPSPSWGSMLNIAKNYMDQAPWMAIWPGLAIFVLVLAFNLLGDGLRDALDPRGR